MTDRVKCTVRDGRFVEPCKTLMEATDNHGFSKARGIFRSELHNMKLMKPSRTYFGIKSKRFPNGILFNNCPFCGEEIDAPFNGEDNDRD